MSTHIIDQIAAVKFPKERTGYVVDYYILATLSGDNNMIDCDTGRRSTSWNAWISGQHYECLKKACEIASDFCGGCVRMENDSGCTPERFIKKCRAALDHAPDYDASAAKFRISNTAITFTPEEQQTEKYYFDRLAVTKKRPHEPRRIYLRGDVTAFPFDFTQPREAAVFIEHLPYKAQLWHHLKLHPA